MTKSTAIAAQSISSLTGILSNPPRYPRNPSQQTNGPVVLYIVRVPGSKDVFLTPLKPPTTTSVGIEAIQSSLYYLHVETAEDAAIRESQEKENARLSNQKENRPPAMHRKPVPSRVGDSGTSPPAAISNQAHQTQRHSQTATQSTNLPNGDLYDLSSGNSTFRSNIPRRPVGMSYQPHGHNGEDFRSGSPESLSSTEESSSRSRHPDVKGRQFDFSGSFIRSLTPQVRSNSDESILVSQHSTTKSPCGQDKITLIRRDPFSGSQWNVGTINLDTTVDENNSPSPIKIDLTTPGYLRFAREPDLPGFFNNKTDAESVRKIINSVQSSPTSPEYAPQVTSFSRRVGFRPLPLREKPQLEKRRSNHDELLENLGFPSSQQPRYAFSFESPWRGLCIFSNGVDGRTVRCQHLLPTLSSQEHLEKPAALALLRFNLPWTVLSTRDVNHRKRLSDSESEQYPDSDVSPRKRDWRRSVQHLRARSLGRTSFHPSHHTEENTRLGREKAGGGFRGRSAKLGKLILEDEGLKMGDLVVAACMGVWWQHYSNTL